jgi:hypothetical protein
MGYIGLVCKNKTRNACKIFVEKLRDDFGNAHVNEANRLYKQSLNTSNQLNGGLM